MFYVDMQGIKKTLPPCSLFLVIETKTQKLIVPCFNRAEAAMVDWYAEQIGLSVSADLVRADSRTTLRGVLVPDLVRQAAAAVSQRRVRTIFRFLDSKTKNPYSVTAIAKRLVKKDSDKRPDQINEERIRLGEQINGH